jgi:glycosyltransferase involved in cell wall biosynthesis
MTLSFAVDTSKPQLDASDADLAAGKEEWPRIALVTPVYNSAKYLDATILSVLAQGYPNLDYFIVDGGSSDGTLDIIRKYEGQISGWLSEPDNGMYDALNKGFARTTGEVMGWISATDQLHVGGLKVVGSVFRDLSKVEWITGRPTLFNEDGMTMHILRLARWSRRRFLAGANRHIQQESTFWRRSLWEKSGGYVDASGRYGVVSDFELWVRFFRHARLYPVDTLIGGYRYHHGSVGYEGYDRWLEIQAGIVRGELEREQLGKALDMLYRVNGTMQRIPKIRVLWRRLVTNSLYWVPGPDWPPVIRQRDGKWRID